MLRKTCCLCLVLLTILASSACFADGEDDEEFLLTKSRLLVEKAKKAEARGEIDEAVASYEEAYEAYPKNILPLLLWGKALYRVGMFARADELLDEIPVKSLPAAGQSEIFLVKGKIAIAMGSLENAAAAFSKSLKALKSNDSARLRLAMVNQILGLGNRADELLAGYENFLQFPLREQVIAWFIDLQLGNLGRAFSTCGGMSKSIDSASHSKGASSFLDSLLAIQPISFIVYLPLALGGLLGAIYYLVLFGGLLFVAARFSSSTSIWHDMVFVFLGTGLMLGAQLFCRHDLMMATMVEQFSINDSVWIVPRLLIAGNLMALSLFFIFPTFRFLPEEQRPRRFEFYGIWFFCWFFMIFVLTFQSRIGFGSRMIIMAVSGVLTFLASFFMPLGKFFVYKLSTRLGISGIGEVDRKDIVGASEISFTSAKILESKAWKLLSEEHWQETVLTARKVHGGLDKKTFPLTWKAMIFALIAKEDFIGAQKAIAEYIAAFESSPGLKETGLLLEAYLKSCKGDFATALKIIRSLPDSCVKDFSQDETALSLLILGRCDLFLKENVQAHIDLNKAFSYAKMPLIKAESLVELIELDFNMNARDSVNKWKMKIPEIKGGTRSEGIKKTISSIVAMSDGDSETALKLAAEACKVGDVSGRSSAWYGHLLCLSGKFNDAEELLGKMAPGSADSMRLMAEVTGSES